MDKDFLKSKTVDTPSIFIKHHYFYDTKKLKKKAGKTPSFPKGNEVISMNSIFNNSNKKIVLTILSFLEFKEINELKNTSKHFQKLLTNKKIIREYALKGTMSPENRVSFYEALINMKELKQKLIKDLSKYYIKNDIYNSILLLANEQKKLDKKFSYVSEQIHKDLNRTFYTHKFKEGNGKMVLNNILTVIAFIRPEIGYCQGMNFIVGALINLIDNEEKCFWIFLYFIDSIDLKKLFSQNIPEYLIKLYQLHYFVNEKFPKLTQILKRNQINLDIFFGKWILTIFSNFLPFETLYNIWDLFIIDKWKAVFKFSIIIVKYMKDELMNMNSLSFSSFVRNNANINLLKFSDLSKFYYDYKITNKKLNELREDFFIEELKSKLEIDSLVWSNEQNTYITNYHIELDDLTNNIKKPAEKLQHQIDIINLEYEHKLKKYEKKLSKVNNLKAKIEQEIEIKTEYENSLKQLMTNFQTQEDDLQKNKNNKIVKKAETHRNKKNFKFYFNHIKYFIKNNSNEYDKIVKKINALNKEIDKNNKALIIECQKLDKKQICYEKVLYKRNEVKSQLDSFLRKSELTKRELIKKLFHKLNPSFFD